jgi:thioredoxin-related protein
MFSSESISIIIVLVIIDIFLPILAIYNDKRDYKDLKLDKYDEISDDLLI